MVHCLTELGQWVHGREVNRCLPYVLRLRNVSHSKMRYHNAKQGPFLIYRYTYLGPVGVRVGGPMCKTEFLYPSQKPLLIRVNPNTQNFFLKSCKK